MTTHKHHIVPRHVGGTNDPSNLIELSIIDHAEAHKLLYEQHGRWQDYVAWQGLAMMVDKEELIRLIQSNASKDRLLKYGNPFTGIQTKHNFAVDEHWRSNCAVLANTPEAIIKKKATWEKTGRGKAEKNSQFGTCWVTHSELGNKKIKQEELESFISLGYTKGRKMIVN